MYSCISIKLQNLLGAGLFWEESLFWVQAYVWEKDFFGEQALLALDQVLWKR
jgi:hypothetical protein